MTNYNGDQVIKLTIENFVNMVDLCYNDWETAIKVNGYKYMKTDGQFEYFSKGSYENKNEHMICKGRIKPQIDYTSFWQLGKDKSDVNNLIEDLKEYYSFDGKMGEMVFKYPKDKVFYQFVIYRSEYGDLIVVSKFSSN